MPKIMPMRISIKRKIMECFSAMVEIMMSSLMIILSV